MAAFFIVVFLTRWEGKEGKTEGGGKGKRQEWGEVTPGGG